MNFLAKVWDKFNRISAPAQITEPIFGPVPPPPMKTERFTEAGIKQEAQRQAVRKHVTGRIIAINNANVVRDYGTHVVDESRPVAQLTKDELTHAQIIEASTLRCDYLTPAERRAKYDAIFKRADPRAEAFVAAEGEDDGQRPV